MEKHKINFYSSSQLTVTVTNIDNKVRAWMHLTRM